MFVNLSKLTCVFCLQIVEYDVVKKTYSKFLKRLSNKLPTQWLGRTSAVRDITFDPRHPEVIILHDDSVICTINKNKVLH